MHRLLPNKSTAEKNITQGLEQILEAGMHITKRVEHASTGGENITHAGTNATQKVGEVRV